MGARPSVWLLAATLLLAAGGLLRLGIEPGAPAAPPSGGGEPNAARSPEPREPTAPPARPAPAAAREPAPASSVPHQVVLHTGGEDARPAARRHRLLVLAVDPHLPTHSLERLLRDLRAHHREAAVLDVRVYDSAELADADRTRYRRDGGTRRARHRVAEMRRNERLGLDVVRIRGVEVEL